jgi:hypothetical protein
MIGVTEAAVNMFLLLARYDYLYRVLFHVRGLYYVLRATGAGANAPIGVAILGDSAAAHFHIPPELVNARSFNASGLIELACAYCVLVALLALVLFASNSAL